MGERFDSPLSSAEDQVSPGTAPVPVKRNVMKALWGHTFFVGSPKHRAEKKGALSPILDSIQEGPAAMLFKSSSLRWGHLSQFR
jgi:hypothetical protein